MNAVTSRTFRVKSDSSSLRQPSKFAMPTDFCSFRYNLSRGPSISCPQPTLKLAGRLNLAQGGRKPSQQAILTEQRAHGLSELRDSLPLLGCEPALWGLTEHHLKRLDLRADVGRGRSLHLRGGWLIFG